MSGIIFFIAQLVIAVAVSFLLLKRVDRRCRQIQNPVLKSLGCSSLILVVVIVTLVVLFILAIPGSSGKWRCLACGEIEWRRYYFGLKITADACSPEDDFLKKAYGASFKPWYWKNVAIEHLHDWSEIGCHYSFTAISCFMRGVGGTFHEVLPLVPNQKVAISMARKVAEASPSTRREFLKSFDWEEPCETLYFNKAMPRELFEQQYAEWLKRHPEWR